MFPGCVHRWKPEGFDDPRQALLSQIDMAIGLKDDDYSPDLLALMVPLCMNTSARSAGCVAGGAATFWTAARRFAYAR
jgi:hypothetical protein